MTVYSGFYEIGQAIFTTLDTLRTQGTPVVWAVYNYLPKIESWISTPAIVICPADWDETILDSCLNDVTFNFSILLFDEIQDNISADESNLRKLADSVIEKLKSMNDVVYSNGQTYKLVFNYKRWFTQTQEPMRICEITCKFSASETK